MYNQTLDNYVPELLKLNERKLKLTGEDFDNWRTAMAFGFLSELLEFQEAVLSYEISDGTYDQIVKEAGDVLAFAVLLLANVRWYSTFDLAKVIKDTQDTINSLSTPDLTDAVGVSVEITKTAQSFYRSAMRAEGINADIVYRMLTLVINVVTAGCEVYLEDITEANITKLKKRAANHNLFTGEGSDR